MGSTQVLLSSIYDSLESVEKESGFCIKSLGDLRADSTVVLPGPNRTISFQEVTYSVPATQVSSPVSSIIIPFSIFDAKAISSSRPIVSTCGFPFSSQGGSLPSAISSQSPIFVSASLQGNSGGNMIASFFPAANNQAYIAVTSQNSSIAAGDLITLTVFFYGGA